MCLHFHKCNKTSPIKPVGYPPTTVSILPPPQIGKSTSLVFDSYFGAGFFQGKENAYADKTSGCTTPYDSCPYPDPPTARAIMRPTTLTGIIPSVKAGR
jgi:hypothetical protein